MEHMPEAKSTRLLTIYSRLVSGETLSRPQLAWAYHVSVRTIQRDMEALRCFISEQNTQQEITYGKIQGGYKLAFTQYQRLTDEEMLVVCKILAASDAIPQGERMRILDKLIDCAAPEANRAWMREQLSEAAGKRCGKSNQAWL